MFSGLPIEILIGLIIPLVVLAAIFISTTLYVSVIINTTLTGFEFGILYPRIIIFLVLFVSLSYRMLVNRDKIEIPSYIKIVFWLFITFAAYSLSVDIFYGLFDHGATASLRKLSRSILPILILFCTLGICRSISKARTFILVFLLCVSISSLVAVMQFLGIDLFWELRTLQGKELEFAGIRSAGLANQSVSFSYLLALGFPWALGFLTYKDFYGKWPKSIIMIIFLVLCAGVIVSLTRSLIVGCIISSLYIILKFRGAALIRLVLPVSILIAALLFFFGLESFKRVTTLKDSSAQGRLPLAINGTNT